MIIINIIITISINFLFFFVTNIFITADNYLSNALLFTHYIYIDVNTFINIKCMFKAFIIINIHKFSLSSS